MCLYCDNGVDGDGDSDGNSNSNSGNCSSVSGFIAYCVAAAAAAVNPWLAVSTYML